MSEALSDADTSLAVESTLSLSELDLAEEKAKAFQEGEARGREAALTEAKETSERRNTELLEQIAAQLPDSARAEEEAFRMVSQECLSLTRAALGKLFPRMEQLAALPEIEAVVEESLSQLRQEPRIVVRLQDAQLDAMKAQLDSLTNRHGFEGKVVLLADPEMGPSDVRVEFADGGIERCARQLWSEIENRLSEALACTSGAGAPTNSPPSPPTQDEA